MTIFKNWRSRSLTRKPLLAREITKDGKTLVLLNAQGTPEWSHVRRRSNGCLRQ